MFIIIWRWRWRWSHVSLVRWISWFKMIWKKIDFRDWKLKDKGEDDQLSLMWQNVVDHHHLFFLFVRVIINHRYFILKEKKEEKMNSKKLICYWLVNQIKTMMMIRKWDDGPMAISFSRLQFCQKITNSKLETVGMLWFFSGQIDCCCERGNERNI